MCRESCPKLLTFVAAISGYINHARDSRYVEGISQLFSLCVGSEISFRPLRAFSYLALSAIIHTHCSLVVALERTFLGYLRTSLALSFLAVFIAQLFRLQHTSTPDMTLGFFVLGIPLASVCTIAAILVLLLGTYRFWRQQNAMLRGKVHAGGWEMNVIGLIILFVCFQNPLSSRS